MWRKASFLRSWRQSETGLWPSPVLLWGVGSQGRPEEWEIQSNIEYGLHWRRKNMEGCPLAAWFRMVEMSSYSKGWEKQIFLFREVTSVKVRCFSTKGFCTFFFFHSEIGQPEFTVVGFLLLTSLKWATWIPEGVIGLFLNLFFCYYWSVLVGQRSSLPWGDVPGIPLGAVVPLRGLAGFSVLHGVMTVFCSALGVLWSGFDLGRASSKCSAQQ